MPTPEWVLDLTGENFLALYDVVCDIRSELQLVAHDNEVVLIRVVPDVVKFSPLMPCNSVNMRDRYGELRWKAANLLKNRDLAGEVTIDETGGHRWEYRIRIAVQREVLSQFGKDLDAEYDRRKAMRETGKETANGQQMAMSVDDEKPNTATETTGATKHPEERGMRLFLEVFAAIGVAFAAFMAGWTVRGAGSDPALLEQARRESESLRELLTELKTPPPSAALRTALFSATVDNSTWLTEALCPSGTTPIDGDYRCVSNCGNKLSLAKAERRGQAWGMLVSKSAGPLATVEYWSTCHYGSD